MGRERKQIAPNNMRKNLASLIKVTLSAVLIAFTALWLHGQMQIPGKYAIRVHGVDSFAGSWHDFMILHPDGTGRMWHGSTPMNWECALSWRQVTNGVEITIPHYIYGATYQNYSEPRTYHYNEGLRSLSGTGRNDSKFVFRKTLLQL